MLQCGLRTVVLRRLLQTNYSNFSIKNARQSGGHFDAPIGA
jgi:hypothetical protein